MSTVCTRSPSPKCISLYYTGLNLCKILPNNIEQSSNITKFQKSIKAYLLSRYWESDIIWILDIHPYVRGRSHIMSARFSDFWPPPLPHVSICQNLATPPSMLTSDSSSHPPPPPLKKFNPTHKINKSGFDHKSVFLYFFVISFLLFTNKQYHDPSILHPPQQIQLPPDLLHHPDNPPHP